MAPYLDFDVDSGSVGQTGENIEYSGLVADVFGGEDAVFEDFDGGQRLGAGPFEDGVEETEELDFIAFFTHDFEEKEVIERVEPVCRPLCDKIFHTDIYGTGTHGALMTGDFFELF